MIGQTERAIYQENPNFAEELRLRMGPLREQWESHGPGMLAAVHRLSLWPLVDSAVTVVLVHPVLGGAGQSYPEYDQVLLEAVLTNSYSELPETVRLAWLISRIAFTKLSLARMPGRLPWIAPLATLAICLEAAESLNLVQFNPHTIQLALRHWAIETPADSTASAIALA